MRPIYAFIFLTTLFSFLLLGNKWPKEKKRQKEKKRRGHFHYLSSYFKVRTSFEKIVDEIFEFYQRSNVRFPIVLIYFG